MELSLKKILNQNSPILPKKSHLIVGVVVIIFITLIVFFVSQLSLKYQISKVNSFADCINITGSRIQESYPEVCVTQEGRSFSRIISNSDNQFNKQSSTSKDQEELNAIEKCTPGYTYYEDRFISLCYPQHMTVSNTPTIQNETEYQLNFDNTDYSESLRIVKNFIGGWGGVCSKEEMATLIGTQAQRSIFFSGDPMAECEYKEIFQISTNTIPKSENDDFWIIIWRGNNLDKKDYLPIEESFKVK